MWSPAVLRPPLLHVRQFEVLRLLLRGCPRRHRLLFRVGGGGGVVGRRVLLAFEFHHKMERCVSVDCVDSVFSRLESLHKDIYGTIVVHVLPVRDQQITCPSTVRRTYPMKIPRSLFPSNEIRTILVLLGVGFEIDFTTRCHRRRITDGTTRGRVSS